MEIFLIVTLVFAVIVGTSTSTKVTLLPSDKENTQITVINESGKQVVDQVGHVTKVNSRTIGPSAPVAIDLDKIKLKHATLFEIQPKKPDSFLLYFESGDTKLLSESQLLISKIIAAAKDKNAPIFNIIGHSDAAGSSEYNYQLSYKRATTVAELLKVGANKTAEYRVESHGENDPLIDSGNELEPQNRRVEVEIW